MLRFADVSLNRDGREVLDQISAGAEVGCLTALLGPNGAGKSTLLALAAGELRPDRGAVHIDGIAPHTVRPELLARHRAILPQQAAFDFDFSVAEVALLGLSPFPELREAEIRALLDSVLGLVDAAQLAERRYPALSGGERQRAQLARVLVQAMAAVVHGPCLLLLDEPVANLDPRHQHLLLAALVKLCAALPLAVVITLHDVNLALRYAQQCWLLRQGRLLAAGPPDEVLVPPLLSALYNLPVRRGAADMIVFG
ncbi:ATP-binding cassette domain-containing protein [Chitinimonas lacunae]|uniref:ATP-binding cassette domain-containing protein n=1 Tax=Chitinimonas lacunae TaxID=1963018 RepID=A0ABV8MUU7_9NEIS